MFASNSLPCARVDLWPAANRCKQHGVTQFLTHLQYESESGALNEHLSDVFGVMVKQKFEQTTAKAADWLIGEGCLQPGVEGVALRSMKQPGTAYTDLYGVSCLFYLLDFWPSVWIFPLP